MYHVLAPFRYVSTPIPFLLCSRGQGVWLQMRHGTRPWFISFSFIITIIIHPYYLFSSGRSCKICRRKDSFNLTIEKQTVIASDNQLQSLKLSPWRLISNCILFSVCPRVPLWSVMQGRSARGKWGWRPQMGPTCMRGLLINTKRKKRKRHSEGQGHR